MVKMLHNEESWLPFIQKAMNKLHKSQKRQRRLSKLQCVRNDSTPEMFVHCLENFKLEKPD